MNAVAPQLVEPHTPVTFAKAQPEYLPLPAAIVDRDGAQTVVTRWQFTDEERAAIANGADLYLEMLTFGSPLQPLRFVVGDAPEGE